VADLDELLYSAADLRGRLFDSHPAGRLDRDSDLLPISQYPSIARPQ